MRSMGEGAWRAAEALACASKNAVITDIAASLGDGVATNLEEGPPRPQGQVDFVLTF